MEDLVLEFDGYAESNGINVLWHNEDKKGYVVILGGWYNTQSGSDVGATAENRQLVPGKVWEPKRWHHYKIVRQGPTLAAYVDERLIFERTVSNRFSGTGALRFDSWNTRMGIDNVKICGSHGNPGNAQ